VQADDALREDFIGAWQQYGEQAGMPAERMTAIIQELMAQQVRATAEQDYVRLLREARFEHVASVLSIMAGGMGVWIAR
jgi:hypothetical protein